MNDIRQRSIQHLANLYATAAGVSLSLGVYRLLDAWPETSLWLFVAFLLTLVPFYHGVLLHLDHAYLPEAAQGSRRHRPSTKNDIGHLFDFVMLFCESFLLVAIAYGVSRPCFFWWGTVLLLSAGIIWVLARCIFRLPNGDQGWATKKWAIINGVALSLLIGMYFVFPPHGAAKVLPQGAYTLFVISFARTAVDYIWCWRFYYPPMANGRHVAT